MKYWIGLIVLLTGCSQPIDPLLGTWKIDPAATYRFTDIEQGSERDINLLETIEDGIDILTVTEQEIVLRNKTKTKTGAEHFQYKINQEPLTLSTTLSEFTLDEITHHYLLTLYRENEYLVSNIKFSENGRVVEDHVLYFVKHL